MIRHKMWCGSWLRGRRLNSVRILLVASTTIVMGSPAIGAAQSSHPANAAADTVRRAAHECNSGGLDGRAIERDAMATNTQSTCHKTGEMRTDSAAAGDGDTSVSRPERDVDSGRISSAVRHYHRTGMAESIDQGAVETFPYGHGQPTVTCAPLRACIIELESGESVVSKIAGDTQRWEIQVAPAGVDGRTQLVVVKPHDCGLTTNLVLATTAGRIYDLTLDSPTCSRSSLNPRGSYARHVRFYYPDAMVETPAAAAPIRPAGASVGANATAVATAFSFAYHIRPDRHVSWTPIAVFDDGAHCYIKMPIAADHREAPVLFGLADRNERTVMNYNIIGDTYVTDRVFRSAELVVAESGREQTVRIDNLRYDASAPSSGISSATHVLPDRDNK